MLRRSEKKGQIWVRLNPLLVESISTGCSVKISHRRFGKWKPLGIRYHIQSDPTLRKLSSFLGKSALMAYVRRAASTILEVAPVAEKWDSLTPAAQRAVTLTDLCFVCGVTPADFLAAAARGCCQAGDRCVLIALESMVLPRDMELAISKWFY
jgi:hypothetical protein